MKMRVPALVCRGDGGVREVVMKADGRISRGTVDTIVGEHR